METTISRDRFYSLADFAACVRNAGLSVTDSCVMRWCRDGKIPGAKQSPGGRWMVPGAALLEFVVRPSARVSLPSAAKKKAKSAYDRARAVA